MDWIESPAGDACCLFCSSVFWCERRRFSGDLWLCVCRLKQLHQHRRSMRLPTCPPWEAVSHFCCFILLLPLLGQREQGEVCSCCSVPPDTTNPPPTGNQENHQKPETPKTSIKHAPCNASEKRPPKTTRAATHSHFLHQLILQLIF